MDAPAVAVSRDGKEFAAAWMDQRTGGNNRRVYWTATSKGTFAKESDLADDPKGLKGHPSISLDEKGTLHAAWEDNRSGVLRIRYRATGGPDVALSPETGKASFPSLACGKQTVGVAYEWGGHVAFATPTLK